MKYYGEVSPSIANELIFEGEIMLSDNPSSVRVYIGSDGNSGWIQSFDNGNYYTQCGCGEYYGKDLYQAEKLLANEHFDEDYPTDRMTAATDRMTEQLNDLQG